nr:ras GTPase-activating protein-binding protein 1 [Leptinotarsa decemlineata]
MVMEAPPSPQSVGREFVRQYYTLLNKAPTHLHRFYNHQSSFVHGGLDPPNRETSPVIGQKQIHQKIQQLNFRDCHAKITQVDSQATLGNEIDKNDASTQVMVEVPQPINPPAVQPYYNPNAAQIQPNIPAVPIHHNQQPPPHVMNPQPVPTVNGAIHPDEINVMQGQVPPHVPTVQPQGLVSPMPTMQPSMIQPPLNPPAPIEELQQPQAIEDPIEEPLESAYVVEQQEIVPEPDMTVNESASNEPKTYANLLKSGSTIPFGSPPSQAPSGPAPVAQPAAARSVSPPSSGGYQNVGPRSNNNGNNMNNRGGPRPNQQPRMQNRQDSGRNSMGGGGRNSINEEGPYEDRRRSQSQNFNDVNQLFLGNLPHMATEDELRDIFSEFGVIVDLRVHSKPPNKIGGAPGGRAPPNYGFITYETQQGVQSCLQAKPIFYPKDDKNGTPLNVEEKKTKDRERLPYGGGRPMDNRGRGDNGGPRRGMGGPGGPNRNSNGGGGPPGQNNRNNTYNNRNNGGPPNRGSNPYNRR